MKEKEPYEITQAKWCDGHVKSPGLHREHVRVALLSGLDVPRVVLKDYDFDSIPKVF